MAQKIISVSISEGDKEFMKHKFLSPSRLLQERITQIRDEENPALRARLKDLEYHMGNTKKKLEFSVATLNKVCAAAEDKFSEDEWRKLMEKI